MQKKRKFGSAPQKSAFKPRTKDDNFLLAVIMTTGKMLMLTVLILIVHHLADLKNIIQLLASKRHTRMLAHHHLDGRCRGDIQFPQEIGIDSQRIAFEIIIHIKSLNDSPLKGKAERTRRKMILVTIDDHITLATQAQEDSTASERARQCVGINYGVIILAVDICKQFRITYGTIA